MDRRAFLQTAAAVSTLPLAACGGSDDPSQTDDQSSPIDDSTSLLLVNGNIHTMDDNNTVIDAIGIRNGKFIAASAIDTSQATTVDLEGRTVVPGLIESHTHFVSLMNRPGYHVAQWELASDVAGVLAALKARLDQGDVPEGAFLTAMGAGTPGYFAEGRLPTLEEIDAVIPDQPVFLYANGIGIFASTNSAGKALLEQMTTELSGPPVINADGSFPQGQANIALYHLRVRQTLNDKKRSALDAMAYCASTGLTANFDHTLVTRETGTVHPELLPPQPTDPLMTLDQYHMYDAMLQLHQEGKVFVRMQLNFISNQRYMAELGPVTELDKQLPDLRQHLASAEPFSGDDMVRTAGIGEWAAILAVPSSANPNATEQNNNDYAVWYEAQRLVAQARWRNENAQHEEVNLELVVKAYEDMDAEFGIKDLRWGVQHLDQATVDQIERLKALNCGVSMSGYFWVNGPRTDGLPRGPKFRDIVDTGIHAALHEDGVHIAPHNPWFAIHYAITGLDSKGNQINPGQQITPLEAMRCYTREASWYLTRENEMGSIEPGKFGDLVVLDHDYFTATPDEIRRTRPVLTIVNGKVIHDSR